MLHEICCRLQPKGEASEKKKVAAVIYDELMWYRVVAPKDPS
jgi:hypothetical protein